MSKYNNIVSNKYFNESNKSTIIQKRLSNSDDSKYNNTIQKGISLRTIGRAAESVGDVIESVKSAFGSTRSTGRSADELTNIAELLGSTTEGRPATKLTEFLKDTTLSPQELWHVIDRFPGLGDSEKKLLHGKFKSEMPSATPEAATPTTSLSPTTASSTPTPTPPATKAPRTTSTSASTTSPANKTHIWNNIGTQTGVRGGVNIRNLADDEIKFLRENLPDVDFDKTITLSKDQLDRVARSTGMPIIPAKSITPPEPKSRTSSSAPVAVNSYSPFAPQPSTPQPSTTQSPQTFRHEFVFSQAPAPEPVRVPESARTPDAQPNPFPNSPYSPDQISRYASGFIAPQQSRKRNFWDRNSALWTKPHEHQQSVNFHLNQYEDLLRGNIKDKQQQYDVASNLVNRGFVNRDTANKVLSDFGNSQRVPTKFNRLVPQAKPFVQQHFSTNIPLSPETIARNAKNKKKLKTVVGAAIAGRIAIPIIGTAINNELSKPKYTGDVEDPNFDFTEYRNAKWARDIRNLAPDLFTAKKDVQKSISKNKKIKKVGAGGVIPGGGSDVDDIAQAAAVDGFVQRFLRSKTSSADDIARRALGRTEYTGNLMQPQEYSTAALAAMRTGYGAFENAGNKSYERIIDEEGNTNWGRNIKDMKTKSIMDSIKTTVKSSLSSPAIKDWAKAYVAETAKKNTGLTDLTPEQDFRRKVVRSTISAMKPVMKSPFGTAITDKLKRDFNIATPQQLLNAGERTAENSVKGVVGIMHGILNFNPLRDVAAEYARRGEKMPPMNFKQIHQQEQGARTRSRINAARQEMLAPFNVPKYVTATTMERPRTTEERKQHDANVATYFNLIRQRFEDVKTGQDISNLNSDSSDTGASRNVGMPSMGLNNRTNEYIATNAQTNKRRDQDIWKSIAWSQGKYKPESKLEEIRLIATLDSLPQTIQAQLKPREKNNIERLLEFFNPPAKEQKVYTALTPSALAGPSQPVVQTSTPTPTVQQQIKATPTVRTMIATSYTNPEKIQADIERAAKAKIQELIRQRGY